MRKPKFQTKAMYYTWNSMKKRCNNPNDPSYHNYGGKGVRVCEEWSDYEPFMKWCLENGWYKGCNISRHGDKGNYEPSNCSIKSAAENRKEQDYTRQQKRVMIYNDNESYTFNSTKEAARFLNKSHDTVGAVARGTEMTVAGFKAKYL